MAEEEIIDWQKEALDVIQDVKTHVNHIEVSNSLVTDGSCVFINISTKEDNHFTVLLDSKGFKIVSHQLDTCDEDEGEEVYESIYSLLQEHSQGYIKSFGETLIDKLEKIQQ